MGKANCIICNNDKIKEIYRINNDYVVKCINCSYVYSIINEDIDLDELYSKGDYEIFDARKTIFENIIYFENSLIFKKIKKICKTGTFLLDFGCGKGKFLYVAKKNNWKTLGVETSIPRANFGIQNYDLKINSDPYIKGKIEGAPFDVITLFHVLEHLPTPNAFINNLVKSNLRKNGLLVLEVPNFNSWQSRIAKSKWLHLDLPKHLSHFNIDVLNKIISDSNCIIAKTESFSIIAGVLGMSNSIMNIFGYKKSVMSELKYNRSIGLMIKLIIVLPISFLLEISASLFNTGGVIRIYAIKKDDG